ncbi:hypothetical protein O181_060729 [Austropuccinia psidii MF-1]|uniref:Uncharacterized protein n=1 Tax=Austropuccinia psidii MF-1 TaxID=1389203 RepID=A0A9Q3EGW9_9BASI|nr:hypothetical protein [Austropuccinia psidii MF-1]
MTPTGSGSSYSIQSNGSGPGNSSHKSKGQDCQPRGEPQMEDARTSTSSQRLARTFDTLIESPEADITSIPVFRHEPFPTGNNRNIPVSVQELVYGGKAAGVGAYAKSLDRHNELISSSEEFHGPRKDRGSSEGLDTHVLQRTSPTDKSLVEKPKHVVRGPQEEVGPRKGQKAQWKLPKPQQAKIHLNKCQRSERSPQRAIRRASKRQRPSGTSLTHRTTEFPRKKIQPSKMYSIWQEL